MTRAKSLVFLDLQASLSLSPSPRRAPAPVRPTPPLRGRVGAPATALPGGRRERGVDRARAEDGLPVGGRAALGVCACGT